MTTVDPRVRRSFAAEWSAAGEFRWLLLETPAEQAARLRDEDTQEYEDDRSESCDVGSDVPGGGAA